MPGNTRDMILAAERRFPVRVRIALPPAGLGDQLRKINRWLDDNCGADGWAMTPSGTRGSDAVSIFLRDATLASAFVTRWCIGYRIEPVGGAYPVRMDAPMARTAAPPHRTPSRSVNSTKAG